MNLRPVRTYWTKPVPHHNSAPPDDSDREAWRQWEEHERQEADNHERTESIELD